MNSKTGYFGTAKPWLVLMVWAVYTLAALGWLGHEAAALPGDWCRAPR